MKTLNDFLREAGIKQKSVIERIIAVLRLGGVDSVEKLHKFSSTEFKQQFPTITRHNALKIMQYASELRRNGLPLLMDVNQLKTLESKYKYLTLPSNSLNRMLTHSNGRIGIRSGVFLELFGPAAVGKTQLCYTTASMCMRPIQSNGWNKGVVFIDTENSFDVTRMMYIARYWRISEDEINKKLTVSRAYTFDELEEVIDAAIEIIAERNIGLIIIDSIMAPLRSQYPLDAKMELLQPRQAHLKRVCDSLKHAANRYNIIVMYTNHIRASLKADGPEVVAQGGNVLSHASDIRIELKHANRKDPLFTKATARIVDCGFLPQSTGEFSMASMGIIDTDDEEMLRGDEQRIRDTGYVCVDSYGKIIDPLDSSHRTRELLLKKQKTKLYGGKA